MPPKKALFQDCVFSVAGTAAPGYTQSSFADYLIAHPIAATASSSVTRKVTHVITTEAEVARKSLKIVRAQTMDIPLVSADWILDSVAKRKRLDITKYLLGEDNTTASTTSTPAATIAVSPTSTSPASPVTPPATAPRTTRGKRKVEDLDDSDESKQIDKKVKELSSTVSKATVKSTIKRPPIDHSCRVSSTYQVYIDDEIAWNARLNQTNIGQNNNKFYLIQLLENTTLSQFAVFSHWGRVGATGQSSTDYSVTLDGAKGIFEKKFKDKTKNNWAERDDFQKYPGKYHLLPPDDGEDDEEETEEVEMETKEDVVIPDSKLHPKVQSLMELIFNQSMMNRQMQELDYDAKKMPLGKLAKSTILHGYLVLKKLGEALNKKKPDSKELMDLSSEFYTVIPHSFGMRTPPVIKDPQTLKKKLEMMEALGEIEIAQKLMKENKQIQEALSINPLDSQFASLKLNKLDALDRESERFQMIERFVKNTHGATHSAYKLNIEEVFDMDREGEMARFDETGFSKFHNRRLLWHGSRLTNFVGILSQGLRIAPPEAPVSGYMFGKGVYFADCVSKSANYCSTNTGSSTGLMLLCEVALGDMHEIKHSDYYACTNSKNAGKHSTKGLGFSYPDENHDEIVDNGMRVQCGPMTTAASTSTSTPTGFGFNHGYGLQYNEYIVYDVSQIKMRYLIRMDFGYKRLW
ncbi:Poly [ADP-ribose] polymerase 2 [Lunasporangiospora selenospora]|uniref:Poly [ADP-ribose] polymerase n=1 Tax=Lunasporangiospora selenospora TaxID=979761 RepID=A0A9P6FXR4_9FUNG|nr:Poly [ADP-ribose] polymerase 2 [Lunasporangiospora selenospora]